MQSLGSFLLSHKGGLPKNQMDQSYDNVANLGTAIHFFSFFCC